MKITFIIPPMLTDNRAIDRVFGCTYSLYPVPNIFELTVAAVIEREGHEVCYVDSVLHDWDQEDFEDFLVTDDSDLYSIYTVNPSINNDLLALEIIRRIRPGIPIMFMGPAPTYFANRFLPGGDTFVVRGEPDYTARDLVNCLDGKGGNIEQIAGLSYNHDGLQVDNPPRPLIQNLDVLPFPARYLIPEKLRHHFCNPNLKSLPYTVVVTSRNCPYQCIYCVPSSLSFARELEHRKYFDGKKPPVKMRSVENVARELTELAGEGYRSISFQDDNFLWNDKRTLAICNVLRETGMIWGCQSRGDLITETRVKAMAESGCRYLEIGVESFDQRILDYVNKDCRVEDIVRSVRLLKDHGIFYKINVLLGTSPLETRETIRNNMKFISELDMDQVTFSIVTPSPGTEFYEIAKRNGWISDGDFLAAGTQKSTILNLPNLSARELEKEVNRCNRRFFIKPKFVFKHINKFEAINDIRTP